FPNLSLQYKASDNHQWSLSYGKRIQRPNYWNLNPLKLYVNPTSYAEGNPFLKPSIIHNTELGYTFLKSYMVTAYHQYITNPISQVPERDEEEDILRYFTQNVNPRQNYGVRFVAPVTLTKWWSMNNAATLSYYVENFIYEEELMENRVVTAYISSSNTFSLPHGIKAELNATYISGGLDGYNRYQDRFLLNFGFRKPVLKEKGSIALNINDPFFWDGWRSKNIMEGIQGSNINTWDSRSVRLSFNYNFGKSTVKSKGKRRTSNSEERNRL
ncbi:outer membrane beta-barrel family protein, partial [Xanthovirga aplysinae]|uniref:outer membrane beta-barrel family protein n=1 Tax=Xanthovirga aplysinae TaxID=2529853 RepID=UPI0012BCCCBC